MTTTTQRPPLPYDFATLREHWLPPEPDDTTVTAARAAVDTLDAIVADAAATLEELETAERAAVVAVVDDAIDCADITSAAANLGRNSEVISALRHHVELLRSAATLARHRLVDAERTDEHHVAWITECAQIEHEWRAAMGADDRTAALLDLIERHR